MHSFQACSANGWVHTHGGGLAVITVWAFLPRAAARLQASLLHSDFWQYTIGSLVSSTAEALLHCDRLQNPNHALERI